MLFFSRRVLPLIRQQVPEASLQIVGRQPSKAIKALDDDRQGIEVTGPVEDIREYFDNAMIYVCSLRSGSGIKNKILEAWAMRTPVVATSLSCEGIDVTPGEDIIIADSPAEIASAVIRLIGDENERRRLTDNARRKVEADYSWERRARQVEEIFERLLAGRDKVTSG
jgi:glycosyltransferase involved in cell wall biosynthesis